MKPNLRAPLVVLALVLVAGLVACDRAPAPEPAAEKAAGEKPVPADTEPAAPAPTAAAPAGVGTWTDDFDGMRDRRLVRMLVAYSKTFYFIDKGTERPIRTPVDPKNVYETTNLFAAYRKGSALLEATLALLGEDTLRKGLRRYLNTHADGNAVANDLFAALTDVSGTDIGAFLGPYLDRPGGPRIAIRRSGDAFTLELSRYWRHPAAGAAAEEPWPVPVRLRIGNAD